MALLTPQSAQLGVTAALNLCTALVLGATMSAAWVSGQRSGWASGILPRLRGAALGGALAAIVTSVLLLWLEAAAMAELPLAQAWTALGPVLGATHYGLAWMIGTGALVIVALASFWFENRVVRAVLMLTLAVFFYTRSMVSHAAYDGDFSLAMASDWLHLILIGVWVGGVAVAAWISLPQPDGRHVRARYIESLSASATLALAGIVATGLAAAWRNVGSIDNMRGNPYADALLLKLALVALAALLGAINRYTVMPPLLTGLRASKSVPAQAGRFLLILRIESVLLAGALVVAAILGSSAPPSAG